MRITELAALDLGNWITKIKNKSILHRALFHLGYVTVLWIAAGFVCFSWLIDPLAVYLFSTCSGMMIFGSGLLLFLDPIEKEAAKVKQELHHEILKHLSEIYECSIVDILSKAKIRHFVDARAIFAFILRNNCGESLSEIGQALERDHSSVSHLVKRTEDMIFIKDEKTCRAVNLIQEKLFNQQ
jgi:DNA-binding MarR family transcriptional regulator